MRTLQQDIIRTLKVLPEIDVAYEIRRSVDFMKHYLLNHKGLTTYVLGISGGQDSTLVGKLAQMAISELREETGNKEYQFIAVRLPYGVQTDEEDAQRALDFIKPDKRITVDIKQATDQIVQSLEQAGITVTDFNKGNIKARQRMIVQYGIAGETKGIVLGTDHAAEAVTGFYTKFGDGGSDIVPIWRLNKRQGRALLSYLGADERLYLKVPTADLEDNKPLLSDEVALGVSYDKIDDYLEGKSIPEKDAKIIEKWYINSQHKRQLPITLFDVVNKVSDQ